MIQVNSAHRGTLAVPADQSGMARLTTQPDGYLLKDQPIHVIVQALQGIAGGHPPLSPAIARRMLGFFQPAEPVPVARPQLTEREVEVLRLIAKGMAH